MLDKCKWFESKDEDGTFLTLCDSLVKSIFDYKLLNVMECTKCKKPIEVVPFRKTTS